MNAGCYRWTFSLDSHQLITLHISCFHFVGDSEFLLISYKLLRVICQLVLLTGFTQLKCIKNLCVCKLSDSQLCLFQIDIFEQQFRSISKIDFMERYLSEVKKKKANCRWNSFMMIKWNENSLNWVICLQRKSFSYLGTQDVLQEWTCCMKKFDSCSSLLPVVIFSCLRKSISSSSSSAPSTTRRWPHPLLAWRATRGPTTRFTYINRWATWMWSKRRLK